MNLINVDSRNWLNEFINGDDFSVDTFDTSSIAKFNLLERVRFKTTVSVRTVVLANVTTEILFETDTVNATWTHPYSSWAVEGFKVGDTIRVLRGVSDEDATISSISGSVMVTNDPGFTAGLTIVSGTSYDDIEFRNTTVPTSLFFKYGVVPNILDPLVPFVMLNPFSSWLDDQTQAYYADGISGSPTSLTGTSSNSAQLTEDLTAEYIGSTSDYIFQFEIIHTFRPEFFKADYYTNFVSNTTPSQFTAPDSFRYICQYKFGTNSFDTNEYRIFNDNVLNGAVGFIDNNFNNGKGAVYDIVSCDYDISGTPADALEITDITSVTIQIQKNVGTFSAGQKAIVYLSKLPSQSEYSNSSTSWKTIRSFDQLEQTDGTAPVDGLYIKNLVVDVNASPDYLDITFDVEYSTAAKSNLNSGDLYFIGVSVGDITLPATTSDRKIVWCDVNQYTKNTDIPDLITDNDINIYTSEKRAGGVGSKFSDVNTWNNRLHIAMVSFNLAKISGAGIGEMDETKVANIAGQVVSRNSTTGISFVLDTFNIPFKATIVEVAGTSYQAVNDTNYRNFNIKPDADANTFGVTAAKPAVFDATQLWTVYWPFVIPWRTAVYNSNVQTSFYDSTKPNNNLNYKTSNYDNTGDWDIYVRLLVTVYQNGIYTQYAINSTESDVKDFDVDPAGFNWTATTKLYDLQGNEIDYIQLNADTVVKTVFSMATAGSLSYARLHAEHTIEEYKSAGSNHRLHSSKDWWFDGNILKPSEGQGYVKITQDGSGNTITVESTIDHTLIDPKKSYTIYSHLQDTT